MRLLSPAKLNLFLRITGRRDNGYHNLQTVFQLLNYGDWITITSRDDSKIELECQALDIPVEDNLIYKAARLLQRQAKQTAGAQITLEKKLPAGGGLGGGSSNAATTLLALNQLWQLGLSTQGLAALGLQLGADVPVFIHGHSAWAEGIGEKITPLQLPEQWYIVIAPNCAVSTAEVFSQQQLTHGAPPITMADFFERGGANDCQIVVRELYPEVDKALIWLNKFGQAQMTGTGSCVFMPTDDEAGAQALLTQIPAQWRGFVAKGTNKSPVLNLLG